MKQTITLTEHDLEAAIKAYVAPHLTLDGDVQVQLNVRRQSKDGTVPGRVEGSVTVTACMQQAQLPPPIGEGEGASNEQ
jgi:hypothetical protein